jgi:hypothetical protein
LAKPWPLTSLVGLISKSYSWILAIHLPLSLILPPVIIHLYCWTRNITNYLGISYEDSEVFERLD